MKFYESQIVYITSSYTIFVYLFNLATPVYAAKVDLYGGLYSFSAETADTSGSKSGLGAYKLAISLPLTDRIEMGLGYSLIFSQIFTGDAVYGIDLEASYFPVTPASPVEAQSDQIAMRTDFDWRPFVAGGYHARQFQSVKTQYNGFSLGIGTEKSFRGRYSLKGLIRYGLMAGPDESSATEIIVVVGLSTSL